MPDHPVPVKVPCVDERQCRRCHPCVARKACRTKAIVVIDRGETPFIDANLCYGCLACVPACPFEAIVA
ncbi:MAG: 4Fe-4S binding protein [Anaerolineales bacterium]|nr:4Fe-4S binding protein [Anaerolineales bacterium]